LIDSFAKLKEGVVIKLIIIEAADKQKVDINVNKLVVKGGKDAFEEAVVPLQTIKPYIQRPETVICDCRKKDQFLFEIY
jgi:hypothetical protein